MPQCGGSRSSSASSSSNTAGRCMRCASSSDDHALRTSVAAQRVDQLGDGACARSRRVSPSGRPAPRARCATAGRTARARATRQATRRCSVVVFVERDPGGSAAGAAAAGPAELRQRDRSCRSRPARSSSVRRALQQRRCRRASSASRATSPRAQARRLDLGERERGELHGRVYVRGSAALARYIDLSLRCERSTRRCRPARRLAQADAHRHAQARRDRFPVEARRPPARMRSQICRASCSLASSNRMTNSSPAQRAGRSLSRTCDAQDGRDRLQHAVADPVREAVVDGLELVDVHHRHRQRPVGRGRRLQPHGQRLLEVAPVRDAGERVFERPALELLRGDQRLLQVPLALACAELPRDERLAAAHAFGDDAALAPAQRAVLAARLVVLALQLEDLDSSRCARQASCSCSTASASSRISISSFSAPRPVALRPGQLGRNTSARTNRARSSRRQRPGRRVDRVLCRAEVALPHRQQRRRCQRDRARHRLQARQHRLPACPTRSSRRHSWPAPVEPLQALHRAGLVALVEQARGFDPDLVEPRLIDADRRHAALRGLHGQSRATHRRARGRRSMSRPGQGSCAPARSAAAAPAVSHRRTHSSAASTASSLRPSSMQHVGQRHQCVGFAGDVAELLEQLGRAPARLAGAPQPRADPVAVGEARRARVLRDRGRSPSRR